MTIGRRTFLAAPMLLAAPGRTSVDPLSGEALFADLARYDGFGPKRTGGPEDAGVTRWLAAEARRAGAETSEQRFTVRQFMIDQSLVLVGGTAIENMPYWFPKPTDGLLSAPLAAEPAAARGRILVFRSAPGIAGIAGWRAAVAAAGAAGAAALIIVCKTPSGELFGHGSGEPLPLPVFLVGDRDVARIDAALAAPQPATVELSGRTVPDAVAHNVIARIGDRGPLTVVSTPTSAWTSAAGERGPGIALWLGLLRLAASSGGRWLFVALSGHELNGAGARTLIASRELPEPGEVTRWCHLGASIATRRFRMEGGCPVPTDAPGTEVRLLTNRSGFVAPLESAFRGTHFRPQLVEPSGARGELRLYFEKGYPAFGFEGPHDFFHGPGDRAWTSGPGLLTPVGRALREVMFERA
jgi:hypothetical protein